MVTLKACGCGSDQVATVCKPSSTGQICRARVECAACGAVGREAIDVDKTAAHRQAALEWNYQHRCRHCGWVSCGGCGG